MKVAAASAPETVEINANSDDGSDMDFAVVVFEMTTTETAGGDSL